MSKAILFFIGLFSFCIASFGQAYSERMLFVIDSIPLINDPEDWNPITQEDIADIAVVKNKDSLKQLGWGQLDGITYIFTKAYRTRNDSLKRIPSLKQMVVKDEVWYLDNAPYNGRYIDYYNSGRKQNEGTLVNGKSNGELVVYFKTGTVKSISDYRNGVLHGIRKEYYKNGMLMQKTGFTEGRSNGLYEQYFINGQRENERKDKKETGCDTVISYYSTGRINQMRLIKNGEPIRGKNENDVNYYATYFQQSLNKGDIKAAEKNFYHLWLLDSTSTEAHLKKGVLLSKEFHFDEAIAEFDKVLQIEPLERNALTQRGLAHLKRHQLLRLKTSLKDKKDVPLTLEDIMSMPEDEQVKACNDLRLADDLDPSDYYVKKAVPEDVLNYCRCNSSR